MNMQKNFTPFEPPYTEYQRFQTTANIMKGVAEVGVHLILKTRTKFAASVEITDSCNAGCNYCYVYDESWDQNKRIKGYLELDSDAHKLKEKEVLNTLIDLKKKGIIHVTLVGGEPTLASDIIHEAAKLFPVVWVVTNGARRFSNLPSSAVIFVSVDGPPELHNRSRDPLGFFANNKYGDLKGMSAAIVRNINTSERGAYVHVTLAKDSIDSLEETVDWLVKDVVKLRGIIVSGTATKSITDRNTFSSKDRQKLNGLIEKSAKKYGWKLFPFNQPRVNQYLFGDSEIIHSADKCSVAERVESIGFDGKNVGKCVLRDDTLCETCVCNVTGLAKAIDSIDIPTIANVIKATYG
jgi:sulfatase maturation enzyme AslB (radical SAM superfamily)